MEPPASLGVDQTRALSVFDGFLAATRRAPSTRRLYLATVADWLAFGGVAGHLDADRLFAWLRPRRARLSPATINRELMALRRFYLAMHMLGIASSDERAKFPRARHQPKRLPRLYTDEQVGALLAQPDTTTFAGLRDHVILRLLYETGMRSSEIAGLTIGDVLPDRTIYVDGGAARHGRYAPISEVMAGLLVTYVERRQTLRPGKRSCLWLTARGAPLRNARSVWEIVSGHARAALGLGGAYERIRAVRKAVPWSGHYPHRLRASMAAAMLGRGCPVTVIAQLLGHADVATTQRYLAVDVEPLRAAIAHHPRATRVP